MTEVEIEENVSAQDQPVEGTKLSLSHFEQLIKSIEFCLQIKIVHTRANQNNPITMQIV